MDAKAKASRAAEIAATTISERKLASALSVIARADEQGSLSDDAKVVLLRLAEYQNEVREPELVDEPVRFTPIYEVLHDDGRTQIVKGPFGIGGRASPASGYASFYCPSCGVDAAFNGARCVRCGSLDDGD